MRTNRKHKVLTFTFDEWAKREKLADRCSMKTATFIKTAALKGKVGKFVHKITSLPNVDHKLWANIEKIMDDASSEKKGYKRRIVSEPPEMYGVDILSCPFHEICKELGCEKAVLCICSMDKEYMKSFNHIRYERTTAVSEGAKCCDYRLRFDPDKE